MSASGHFQYIRGYHNECGGIPCVHQGCFSTLERYHEYIRGNIMSTLGDVQYMWESNLINHFNFY